jgi:hypothetical protein
MKKRILIGIEVLAVVVMTAGAVLFAVESNPARQIGPNTATPAYIVVNTPTPVIFTSVIADSSLKKQDPKKVLLIRTDASGTPIDIIGRMNDRGKKADASKNDNSYTIQVSLNESSVGQAQFRIAAKFKDILFKGKDDDDDEDWDKDLASLNDVKAKGDRRDRLPPLLRRLQRFTLSDPVQVTVDPFKLPPDPGDAGKLTLEGIDSDHDGVRDDIQRYIAYTAPTSPNIRGSLSQLAISYEHILDLSSSPVATLVAVANDNHRALDCLAYATGEDGQAGLVLFEGLQAQSLNTKARSLAFATTESALSGTFFPPPDPSQDAAACTFQIH